MEHKPFIPASKSIAEVTIKSVLLGITLGVVLSAANAYFGLYAGMTVGASIPAAVISMAVLRGILRSGTILENNIVQTIASTGESLAAGIIFTVPAMVLTGVWTEIEYWPTTLICITGGLLGVLFMIPLRKSLIVEDKDLTYPEGVACAEVLKAGETGGSGVKALMGALALGSVFKFFVSGVSLFKGSVAGAWSVGRTGAFFGLDISPALMAVGYIIGRNVAIVVFLGSAIAWLIGLPIMGIDSIEGDVGEWFWNAWDSQIRFMGVGAMVVGGMWSIFSIRRSILHGIQEAVAGYKGSGGETAKVMRTEESIKSSHIGILLVLTTITVFFLYHHLIGKSMETEVFTIAGVSTIAMVVLSFFFVAVASYICGLVGSSNSPVSGMTICAVLATGGMLLAFDMTGVGGMVATLGVAGVVCCAACCSGDISQDLKTGYLLGATPKKQQWMEVVGVVVPSFFIAPVLMILQETYGIGGETGLKAPQANLFASIAQGLFGEGEIPWNMVLIGAVIGIVIIAIDQVLAKRKSEFRMPIMAAAIGIYLPLTLNVPILIGGLIAGAPKKRKKAGKGVLFSSGLIAGESIMGILVALLMFTWQDKFPINPFDWDLVSSLFTEDSFNQYSNALSLAAMAGIALLIFRMDRAK
jgi:putative OPT family oligopeptide transporter